MLRHEHFSCKSSKHHAPFYKLLDALMIKIVQVQATLYIYDMIQIWQKTVWPTRKTRKRCVKCSRGCRETLPKQTLAGVAHVFLTSIANKILQNHFFFDFQNRHESDTFTKARPLKEAPAPCLWPIPDLDLEIHVIHLLNAIQNDNQTAKQSILFCNIMIIIYVYQCVLLCFSFNIYIVNCMHMTCIRCLEQLGKMADKSPPCSWFTQFHLWLAHGLLSCSWSTNPASKNH